MSDEPEAERLDSFVSTGDWIVDVGANIGHYTKRGSELVGPCGRVIAMEPVPATFELLAANCALFPHSNVSLLNLAASDRTSLAGIGIPLLETGLRNYYQANLVDGEADLKVMTLALDSLDLDHRITLIKIDAEGHDPVVLRGAHRLLERDHPTIIIETPSESGMAQLKSLGYLSRRLPDSPNTIFEWKPSA